MLARLIDPPTSQGYCGGQKAWHLLSPLHTTQSGLGFGACAPPQTALPGGPPASLQLWIYAFLASVRPPSPHPLPILPLLLFKSLGTPSNAAAYPAFSIDIHIHSGSKCHLSTHLNDPSDSVSSQCPVTDRFCLNQLACDRLSTAKVPDECAQNATTQLLHLHSCRICTASE